MNELNSRYVFDAVCIERFEDKKHQFKWKTKINKQKKKNNFQHMHPESLHSLLLQM